MATRHGIAVGASAGGLEALLRVVKGLPADLPAAVFVVVHSPPDFPSRLPESLSREGRLPAAHARDGEEVRPGRIYVAPPNYHLTVDGARIRVTFGPKVNAFRPAIDPLFRSAAEHAGGGAVGVLLSGGMTDGVGGLLAIQRAGGVTVVQDPADAAVPGLPKYALTAVHVNYVVAASEMGRLLVQLAGKPAGAGVKAMPDTLTKAQEAYRHDIEAQTSGARVGQIAVFSCPNCGGVMRQTDETKLAEFLCHVGHAYEGEALLEAQAESIEATSWNLVRALKERALLARELAGLARGRDEAAVEARFTTVAEEAERQQKLVEDGLLKGPTG
jgi:two-component system chemotaxis response regulator CheB